MPNPKAAELYYLGFSRETEPIKPKSIISISIHTYIHTEIYYEGLAHMIMEAMICCLQMENPGKPVV